MMNDGPEYQKIVDINAMFNALSDFIGSTTNAGDIFEKWMADLSVAYQHRSTLVHRVY